MLANAAAANRYLDGTKVKFANDDDAGDEIIAADAVIRGALQPVYGSQVYTWEFGGATEPPEVVTEHAAMWMAALRYSKRYSEETLIENSFANKLMKMVYEWLEQLRSGSLTIEGVTSEIAFSEDDFWPNSTDVIEGTQISKRKFTMDQIL